MKTDSNKSQKHAQSNVASTDVVSSRTFNTEVAKTTAPTPDQLPSGQTGRPTTLATAEVLLPRSRVAGLAAIAPVFIAVLVTASMLQSSYANEIPLKPTASTVVSEASPAAVMTAISGPAAFANGIQCGWVSERNDCRVSRVDNYTQVQIIRPRLHNYAIAYEQITNEILEYNGGSGFGMIWSGPNRRYPDPQFGQPDSRFSTGVRTVPLTARQFCWHIGFVDAVDFSTANTSRSRLITFHRRSSNIESAWTVDSNPDRRYESITCRGVNAAAPRHNIKIYDGSEVGNNYVVAFVRSFWGSGPRDVLVGMWFGSGFFADGYVENLWYSRRSGDRVVGNLEYSQMSDVFVRGAARRFCFYHHRNDRNQGGLGNVDSLGYTKSDYFEDIYAPCRVVPTGYSCSSLAYNEDDFGNGRGQLISKRPTMDYFRTITCFSPVVNEPPRLAADEGVPPSQVSAVVNAATGRSNLTSGAYASVFGSSFLREGEGPYQYDNLSLSPVSVMVGGRQAELYYASAGQLNVRIPEGLISMSTSLDVFRVGSATPIASIPISISEQAPGIFTFNQSGTGIPAGQFTTVERSGSLTDAPVPLGTLSSMTRITLWVNGVNPITVPGNPFIRPGVVVYLSGGSVAGYPATIEYASASQFRGLFQINFVLPPMEELRNQRVEVRLEVDGIPAQDGIFLNVGG